MTFSVASVAFAQTDCHRECLFYGQTSANTKELLISTSKHQHLDVPLQVSKHLDLGPSTALVH